MLSQRFRTLGAVTCLVLAAILLVRVEFPSREFGFDPVTPPDRAAEDSATRISMVELTQAVGLLQELYVFENRLSPRRMLVAALQSTQDAVDAFLVSPPMDLTSAAFAEESEIPTFLTLAYRNQKVNADLSRVVNLYSMAWKLTEILSLFPWDDAQVKKVEDAAIAGMLRVLDPHTNYLDEAALAEMRMSTEGKFGGLGIVIQVRDGELRIVSVIPGTPASRAGLRKSDRIAQIDSESTINMTVSEAARRMRGRPGTAVSIALLRAGSDVPEGLTLLREEIRVKSVLTQAMPRDIAYLRVKGFQENSAHEIEAFLDETYSDAPPHGIVLDLRGNSGGVMSAAVRTADLFLEGGFVVSTLEKDGIANRSERATRGDRYEGVPLVVLVDHGSASASEIVTAAVKYTDRAVVMGERTFGKGSVQYLRELQRGALKLTIAQYVGPQSELIQGIGIEPHVELMWIGSGVEPEMPGFGSLFRGEADLPYNLQRNGTSVGGGVPLWYLTYVDDSAAETELEYDSVTVDPPVELAWEVLTHHGNASATRMLQDSASVFHRFRENQDLHLDDLLSLHGRRWEAVPGVVHPDLDIEATFPGGRLQAGNKGQLVLSVTNRSSLPVSGLYARTDSMWTWLADRSCILGTLLPGQGMSCTLSFAVPRNTPRGKDWVFVDVLAGLDEVLTTSRVPLRVDERDRARVAFSLWVDDSKGGNGDGLIQDGEAFDVVLDVANVGTAPLEKALAVVKNQSGASLLLGTGRQDIHDLLPGESRPVRMNLSARDDPDDGWWKFEAGVLDLDVRRQVMAAISWPVSAQRSAPTSLRGTVTGTVFPQAVYAGPDLRTPIIARIMARGDLLTSARRGTWLKIAVAKDQFGWIPERSVRTGRVGQAAPIDKRFVAWQPWIALRHRVPDEEWGTAEVMTLEGDVDFGTGVPVREAGLTVLNNQLKVDQIYLGDLEEDSGSVPFRVEVPLFQGSNRIVLTVFQKDHSLGYTWLQYNREPVPESGSSRHQGVEP